MRTIAKFRSFVILAGLAAVMSCGSTKSRPRFEPNPNFNAPKTIGTMQSSEIPESSGIAISRCQPNVMWTHNDSGDDEFLFAIDMTGKLLATYRVTNAKNKDWEDVTTFKDASGKCFVYIGEIGDNELKREAHFVYRVPEPVVPTGGPVTTKKDALQTQPADAVEYTYSDRDHNAEAVMVHPVSGDIYVVTKERSTPAAIFKIKPTFGSSSQVAEKLGDITVPSIPNGLLTGGDISPDGKHVILCDYLMGYELTVPDGAGFDEVWKQKPVPVDIGKRKDGEAVTYTVDGSALIATCEGVGEPIFQIERKK